ncbi:MAG: hypothetical protein Kow0059_13610 [Candidatus Sumerlaeia bacterium]
MNPMKFVCALTGVLLAVVSSTPWVPADDIEPVPTPARLQPINVPYENMNAVPLPTAPQGQPTTATAPPELAARLAAQAARVHPPAPQTVGSPALTATIFSDDFEGAFPGTAWTLHDFSLADQVLWGKATNRKANGTYSVYCAGGGPAGCDPGAGGGCTEEYYNDQNTWMTYGPFSLADATAGGMQFNFYNVSEDGWDFFKALASIDGSQFYGLQWSGDSGGWQPGLLDFTNVFQLGDITGQPNVWIAFVFRSDILTTNQGAYVDDVVISKTTAGPTPTPTPTPTPPGPTPTPTPTPTPPGPTPSPTPTPISKTFTIYNDGNGTLNVNPITKEKGSVWFDVVPPGTYPVKIAPQANATFTVNVYPHTVGDGTYNDRLLITSNDTTNSPVSDGVYITYTKGVVVVTAGEVVDHILGRAALSGDKLTAADKNQNNKVEVGDVIIIVK